MYLEIQTCTLDNLDIDHPKSVYTKLVNFIGEEQAATFVNTIEIPLGMNDT